MVPSSPMRLTTRHVAPMPLTFEALTQALDYVRRTPGTLRIVEVTDEGERLPAETVSP